jgi:hypothetical protein
MRSKTNKHQQTNSKKKCKGGSKCNEFPYIWLNDENCLIKCPEGTCRSYNINDEFICRPLQNTCIITNIENNNKLTDDDTLYNSDGYLFTDSNNINSLYYGKITKTKDEKINKDGLGLLINTTTDDFYYGNFKKDLKHGRGIYKWTSGDSYSGDWKDDMISGNGEYKWVNGDRYNGDWKDGIKEGNGIHTWSNENSYDGQWKDDMMNGKGQFIWANRNSYDGEWKDDMRNGKGQFIWANGDSYDGEWKDGLKNGYGIKLWVNGNSYDGEWKDGLKNGYGIYIYDGNRYDGYWKDDMMHGRGQFIGANGDSYTGDYENDKMHGRGQFIGAKGDSYHGDWKYGLKDGTGLHIWKDGNSYEGEWKDDFENGKGKYISKKNGHVFEGIWEDGLKNGKGTQTSEDYKYEGTWKDGFKSGEFIITYASGKIKKTFFKDGDGDNYHFNKDINKYYIDNPAGDDNNKFITILIYLHGSDIINSICQLNESKHVRILTPVSCGMINLGFKRLPLNAFNIAYNISHLSQNNKSSSHQKIMKTIELYNQENTNMYDFNEKTYNRPIIDHKYTIEYDNEGFDLSKIYVIDTNFNAQQLFKDSTFDFISEKFDELRKIYDTEIYQFDILDTLLDHMLIYEKNGDFSFLRSDLINVLLNFGYDTINMIDLSCRVINEEIISNDYNETTNKNYQCHYIINKDESTYLGDDVKSIYK